MTTFPSTSQRFIIPDLPTAEEILPFLKMIDENRWYSNFGPLANSFERIFTQAMGAFHGRKGKPKPCVALASGYHALSVGLRMVGVGPKKKVLIPAVTFPACPLAVQNLGAEPLLGDVDPDSWVLTPKLARQMAEKGKIDAVMPVSLYGFPLPADEWDRFIEETGIPVIIDAAAAIETQRYPEKAYVAHSLHALKPMGIGEGGLLITPDKEKAITVRQIINFGMQDRITYRGGENAKMSEYHAAVALAQLERWEGIKARRRKVYETYKAALCEISDRANPHSSLEETVVSNLMVRINIESSSSIMEALLRRGIAAHRTYLPPLYTHPHFADLTVVSAVGNRLKTPDHAAKAAYMRGAETMNTFALGLPFHAFMSDEEIHRAVKILGEYLDP